MWSYNYNGISSTDPNNLTHWKYVSREKVNGKWKYTYPRSVKKEITNSSGKLSSYRQQLAYKETMNYKVKEISRKCDKYIEKGVKFIIRLFDPTYKKTYSGTELKEQWKANK